jgi:hypothetical protein
MLATGNISEKITNLNNKILELSNNITILTRFNEHYQDIILCDFNCISTYTNISGVYEYDVKNSILDNESTLLIWKNHTTGSELRHKITYNKINNVFSHEYFIFLNADILYKTLDTAKKSVLRHCLVY